MRDLRLSRELSQEALANQLHVSPRYLAGIERGERNLSLDTVELLAGQLGVSAVSLLDMTNIEELVESLTDRAQGIRGTRVKARRSK